ncbi:MAG TPA: hypothetical protein VF796_20335 [Humisphaera sp.]
MEFERVAFMEHFSFRSDLDLNEACGRLSRRLGLPPFEFDCENDTEWGLVEVDGVEVNVSRPYAEGKLQEWIDTTPPGCNFGVILIVAQGHPIYPDHERAMGDLVPTYAQRIADAMCATVFHHRLWLGPGELVRQAGVFNPASRA